MLIEIELNKIYDYFLIMAAAKGEGGDHGDDASVVATATLERLGELEQQLRELEQQLREERMRRNNAERALAQTGWRGGGCAPA